MSEEEQKSSKGPFIRAELRPQVGPDVEDHPPLKPGASREEIQRRATESIDETEQARLGLTDEPLSLEIWQKIFAKSSDDVCKVLDGEGVLLNLENGFYYTLNRVGTAIWELFTGDQSLERILTAIRDRFDVAENKARADLIALVVRLHREQLIIERR